MPDMRRTDPLQADGLNLSEFSWERCVHFGGQRVDFLVNRVVQGFDAPFHSQNFIAKLL